VVNKDARPVLQVFYKRSNEIQVNGIFIVGQFDILESFGGQAWLISSSVQVTESQTTQDLSPEVFNQKFTNYVVTLDTNAAYHAEFTDQKPIFKYPAWKYPGVPAE
jgi:hypothetical protein